jgi:hypothetical protein
MAFLDAWNPKSADQMLTEKITVVLESAVSPSS